MRQRVGFVYGIGAYVVWGLFPLYFSLLTVISPFEIVPWRVFTALTFCLIAVTLLRGWNSVRGILRSPKKLGWFALSSALLYANWQVYVLGVMTGHIIETALGYFINPLVTILFGVFLRKEQLRRLQWAAVGIAGLGVIVSAVAYGRFPFIALSLALTFSLYGLVRKQTSGDVEALTALTIETMVAVVFAAGQLVLISVLFGRLSAFDHGPGMTTLVLLSGLVTVVPLLLFGASTRRLPLSYMGFVQFVTPIIAFMSGYFIFNEEMPTERWIGFIAVWLALILLIIDMVRVLRWSQRPREIPAKLIANEPR